MDLAISQGGGNDSLQVGIAVFCVVVSIATAMLVPILAPSYDTGYSYQEVFNGRAELESFTGESMTSQTPWKLTGVYTPYVPGEKYTINEEGWLYGSEVTDYEYLNKTTGIKLDPGQKSSMLFGQGSGQATVQENKWWYAEGFWGDLSWAISSGFWGLFGSERTRTESHEVELPTWNYTGYRYEFDPMMTIQTNEDGSAKTAASDAKLSIIWYDIQGSEGISGGLILYTDKSNGVVANYSATDIISNYNLSSQYASSYVFDFNGTKVRMYIQFDPDVVADGTDLSKAWTEGRWSVAFSATSVDNLFNIANSNSLSTSLGNLLSSYAQIFTFSVPNMPLVWSMVLWILCILPAEIIVLMFLSRFGAAGIIAGILGNIFLGWAL